MSRIAPAILSRAGSDRRYRGLPAKAGRWFEINETAEWRACFAPPRLCEKSFYFSAVSVLGRYSTPRPIHMEAVGIDVKLAKESVCLLISRLGLNMEARAAWIVVGYF